MKKFLTIITISILSYTLNAQTVFFYNESKSYIENRVEFLELKQELSGKYLQEYGVLSYTGIGFSAIGGALVYLGMKDSPTLDNPGPEILFGSLLALGGSTMIICAINSTKRSGKILQVKFSPVEGKIVLKF